MSQSASGPLPSIRFRNATFNPQDPQGADSNADQPEKQDASPDASAGIYFGSLGTPARNSPAISIAPSQRTSLSHLQLQPLLAGVDIELEDFGLTELRDGFFDATFYRPLKRDHGLMSRKASQTLPRSLQKRGASTLLESFLYQRRALQEATRELLTSRSGIKLLKSFSGFSIAYILCLIPATAQWIGPYAYVTVISAILNHPGRSIGSQIDGALLTTLGSVAGSLWGILALYTATSTFSALTGYGGVVTTFLIIFTASLSWLRCVYNRFYQAILCAGIAIFHMTLADTTLGYGWQKFSDYMIPWCLGQAICILVCFVVFPAAGSRPIAVVLHSCFQTLETAFSLPHSSSFILSRDLAMRFVELSDAVRDFRLDLAVSPLSVEDVLILRNTIQPLIRAALAIRPETTLFRYQEDMDHSVVIPVFTHPFESAATKGQDGEDSTRIVCETLADPIKRLIAAERTAVRRADAAIMDFSGHRRWLGPENNVSSDVTDALITLRSAMAEVDIAERSLTDKQGLPMFTRHPEVVDLFLFVQPVRQAAQSIAAFLETVIPMRQSKRSWRVNLPSYPWKKGLMRSNAQVRHDRGGITAGTYFRTKELLARSINQLQSRTWTPLKEKGELGMPLNRSSTLRRTRSSRASQSKVSQASDGFAKTSKRSTMRYKLWKIFHRLQGFESRFATKVTILCALVAIPAWLTDSQIWWNESESWWILTTIWIMMTPRSGGNFNDLGIRTFCAFLGALWGGLAMAAGNGSPYVIAVFAAIFMVPMLSRFTQSAHPRSGIIGCISFVVVSLREYELADQETIVHIAWTRGLALTLGVFLAVSVNWVLWPFVARHELRKSISMMLLHSSILYRSVVARYVYYDENHKPVEEDVKRSELLEGRLREGFVSIRQLMELTKHELRLRAPFDPLPYSALIQECEAFFERLIDVRQSSLFFHPHMLAAGEHNNQSLLALRRDAVAAILMNLYILAGALRSNRPVPRYLASAANARKRLLDRMEDMDLNRDESAVEDALPYRGRKWSDVYYYAYSSALTDIVDHLQQLQYYTKQIVGEVGFDLATAQ